MFCFYCYDGGDTNSIDCCFVFTGIRDSRGDSQPNWLYIPCVQLFKICSSYENENSHLELSFVIKSETTIPLLGYPTICQSLSDFFGVIMENSEESVPQRLEEFSG